MAEYIGREAAIKAIRNDVMGGLNAEFIVNELPAADVRPVVRGKWIPDFDYEEYDFDGSTPLPEPREFQDGWQCNLCGGYMPYKSDYCPNCGADMRGVDE